MHKIDMVMDFQFGSTGKGLIAGWLAKREKYDTAVCSFATNAGHTYIDKSRGIHMMTQQLPTAISSPTVKNVLLGPGAIIHVPTLLGELERYAGLMKGKRLIIHPSAAILDEHHARKEVEWGLAKIGSTTKGVMAAAVERMMRVRDGVPGGNTAGEFFLLKGLVTSREEYDDVLGSAESLIIEGAQGFGLSMYHGFYPYTTSRDVTPWQIAADCGIPYRHAPYIKVVGACRTYPIRVNNRDGSSGPGYNDQREVSWEEIGVEPELTTVTKLPRRIFTFSKKQMEHALIHCGGYWETRIFLNFANYCKTREELVRIVDKIATASLNPPIIGWFGYGPDDADVLTPDEVFGNADK